MRTAVTVIVILASVGLVAALGVWLSWRSPAALSEEDTPFRPLIVDGVGRPAGPDAEAMGVLDRAAANRALARVLIAEAPTVRPDEVDPAARPKPAIAGGSVDELLTALGREASAAADRIERVPAESWSRAATVDYGSGRTVTALDVARAAVDAGVGHLRAAGNVLAAVQGSAGTLGDC
jgi:hypothetical protein